jgi:hypothetical protein
MKDHTSPLRHEARFTLLLGVAPEVAWRVLVDDIDTWWPPSYRAVSHPSNMRFNATLGGRLEEIGKGENGVLWYTVQAVEAPSSITLAGFIAPPFGGPALSLLRIALTAQPDGLAMLELHDSIVGHADSRTVEEGWREIFGGLVTHLARRAH